MKAVAALLKSFLLSNVRNRQGLFWTLFFPVLLMLVFGLLGNSSSFKVNLAITGPQGAATREVVSTFKKVPIFAVTQMSLPTALSQVRSGKEDAVLIVPSGAALGHGPLQLDLRYNNSNYLTSQQTVAAIEASIAQINLALSGQTPTLAVSSAPVAHSQKSTYLDFLLPGLLALMAMQNSLFGIGAGLVRWKEKGVLRRFRATPVTSFQFLGATVINYLIFSLLTATLIIGIAVGFLHATVNLVYLPVLVTLVAGIAAFLAIGFIIAGFAKTQEATMPLINLITFPMMFLSGVFFPLTILPKFLLAIVKFFPLTFLVQGLRGIMSGQFTGFSPALWGDLLGLGVWFVAAALVASRTWRWE